MFRSAISAALVLIVLAVGVAAATGGGFDPDGKPPTKGFVAVEAYKWLRDNAPDAISECDKRTDQYTDLDQNSVSKFKREAINCLASIGFFDNYPDVPPRTVGEWVFFHGTERLGAADAPYYGYWLNASASATLYLRCDAGGDNSFDGIVFSTVWQLENESLQDFDLAYRFSGRAEVDDIGWQSDELEPSLIWYHPEYDGGAFLDALRSRTTGYLYVRFADAGTATFTVTGIAEVLNNLDCY